MSNELIVALVVSGTSFVVALVGLVSSIVSNRQSARSSQALESLKYDFSRLTNKETLGDTQLVESLRALQLIIQTVQLVKDETQLVLSATNTSLSSSSAIKRIETAREKMFSCYEEMLPNLSEWESQVAHRAKNIALLIEIQIKSNIEPESTANLSNDNRHQLTSLRNELTEIQQVLRDSKNDRLLERMRNV
jgi:hypothetical protein